MEEAVERQDPKASGLKRAFDTLGRICQQLALGC
jgi:hypothetical protein